MYKQCPTWPDIDLSKPGASVHGVDYGLFYGLLTGTATCAATKGTREEYSGVLFTCDPYTKNLRLVASDGLTVVYYGFKHRIFRPAH